MGSKYRTLRLVVLFYQVLAWITLIGGALAGVVAVILGAISGRAGRVSPLVAQLPLLNQAVGLVAGLMVGLVVILGGVICFVLLYATSEVVQLGLAIERNTRETAQYIRGEAEAAPAAGQGGDWA